MKLPDIIQSEREAKYQLITDGDVCVINSSQGLGNAFVTL